MAQISEVDIAKLFYLTHRVLGESAETIKSFFPDAESIQVIPNLKALKSQLLEIRLETLTFTCLLTENNICNSSFLFLDRAEKMDEIIQFIDYCNNAFVYNFILKAWYLGDNCSADLRIENTTITFVVSKLEGFPKEIKHLASKRVSSPMTPDVS